MTFTSNQGSNADAAAGGSWDEEHRNRRSRGGGDWVGVGVHDRNPCVCGVCCKVGGGTWRRKGHTLNHIGTKDTVTHTRHSNKHDEEEREERKRRWKDRKIEKKRKKKEKKKKEERN